MLDRLSQAEPAHDKEMSSFSGMSREVCFLVLVMVDDIASFFSSCYPERVACKAGDAVALTCLSSGPRTVHWSESFG